MYTSYYGFSKKPFDITPDPEALFLGENHKEALAVLKYGILDNKGFLLLTGDVGTGKTTLINSLVKTLEQPGIVCVLSNPSLNRDEFYHFFSEKLGVKYNGNKAEFLLLFNKILKHCAKKKARILLIIDEAHVLPVELMEEIRLLSNMTGEVFGVLSIFLVGQPELIERMADKRLLPLRQRIGVRFTLCPFPEEETIRYIRFRLKNVGSRNFELFPMEVMKLIHKVCGGTPRLINILCDQALITCLSKEKKVVDKEMIIECVNELQMPGESIFAYSPVTKRSRNKLVGFALLILAGAFLLIGAGLAICNGPTIIATIKGFFI